MSLNKRVYSHKNHQRFIRRIILARKLNLILVSVLLFVFIANIFSGLNPHIKKFVQDKSEINLQKTRLQKMREKNQMLAEKIHLLHNDDDFLKTVAREKLNLIESNEIVLVDNEK